MRKPDYPGGHSREQWRALDRSQRRAMVRRALADLLGSFRYFTNKCCRRYRTCSAADPQACADRP
jgi:hypothetical protein